MSVSVFASRVPPVTVPVPHDPANAITFRKLAPKTLDKAAKAQQKEFMASVDVTNISAMKAFAEIANDAAAKKEKPVEDAPETKADPTAAYHPGTLLVAAIVSWTFMDADGDIPVTVENIEDMDDETQTFAMTEALKLSKPSLFQTAEQAEAAQVKG